VIVEECSVLRRLAMNPANVEEGEEARSWLFLEMSEEKVAFL
jgi:hypothetical protein